MDFTLRRATHQDLDAVGRITVEAYRDGGFIGAEDDYLHELADASSRARDAELWVAVDATGVLGSVTYCLPGTAFAELSAEDEGEFRMLSVASGARRRGVAEALVLHCIERSRNLGHRAVVLCSMRQMSTAHRLYQRLGFQRLPERDWSPERDIELLAFRLELSDDSVTPPEALTARADPDGT
jgi:ribosomal protein S18 acetylase RimI-like enzyme